MYKYCIVFPEICLSKCRTASEIIAVEFSGYLLEPF